MILIFSDLDLNSTITELPSFMGQSEEKNLGTQALVAFDNQLRQEAIETFQTFISLII
jgi:hypothetical protein